MSWHLLTAHDVGDPHDWDTNPLVPEGFVCDSLSAVSPVELTTSWLATNLYEGCSFGCIYCFRLRWNPLPAPERMISVEEGVRMLLEHPKFRPHHTPLSVNVRSTDPLHPRVRNSTMSFVEHLDALNLRNPVGVVTKGLLTAADAERIASLKNVRFVLLVSYSGMPLEVEPIPKRLRIESMETARAYGIQVILSFKPVVSSWNDSQDQIEEVMAVARDHANAIVFGGLRLDPSIASSIVARGRVVPIPMPASWGGKTMADGTRDRIELAHQQTCPHIPLYKHTSCAMSFLMEMKNYNSLRKRDRASCSHSCPVAQVARCEA